VSLLSLDTININSITSYNNNIVIDLAIIKNVTNKLKHLINYKVVFNRYVKVANG
jgi:hypothetical protein